MDQIQEQGQHRHGQQAKGVPRQPIGHDKRNRLDIGHLRLGNGVAFDCRPPALRDVVGGHGRDCQLRADEQHGADRQHDDAVRCLGWQRALKQQDRIDARNHGEQSHKESSAARDENAALECGHGQTPGYGFPAWDGACDLKREIFVKL